MQIVVITRHLIIIKMMIFNVLFRNKDCLNLYKQIINFNNIKICFNSIHKDNKLRWKEIVINMELEIFRLLKRYVTRLNQFLLKI